MKIRWYILAFILAVILVFTGMAVSAPKRPMTVAELALYEGADRQQILEEGAKKEGKLTFYTIHILTSPLVNAFQKKYPYIKVEVWRGGTTTLVPRVLEEYKASRYVVDVIDQSPTAEIYLEESGILQPFYSPNLAYIEEAAIKRSPGGGAFAAGRWESCVGLGYNTKLITKKELPKTYQDLLNPKWKDKMPITGSNTSVSWVGTMLFAHGEDFVRRVAEQKFTVHMVSARGLLDMIINGEYAFSPTIYDSHVNNSKEKGGPVDWVPLEPVYINRGQISLPRHTPNPHAALLFIDFELSREAGELYKATGYNSPRKDIFSPRTYKKYYGPQSTEQDTKWMKLFDELFLKK